MKQNLKDALMLLSEAVDELASRANLARDRMAVKIRHVAGESGRIVEALSHEQDKVKRVLAKVKEFSVALKNGEI